MNKRQWLRQQGFSVGERGRFSQPMLDALATCDVVFDSPTTVVHTSHGDVTIEKRKRKQGTSTSKPAPLPEVGWVMLDEVRRKDLPNGYVVKLPNGHTTTWSVCSACKYSVKFCQCGRPTPPPWLSDATTIDVLL